MHLEFEKPIVELEGKLADMKRLAKEHQVDVSDNIKELEAKIRELKKETFKNLTRWQRVQLSRHPERPYTLDYIHILSDRFVEIHGDRTCGDDKALVGGFAEIGGKTLMMLGQQKGRNTKQRQYRNFGMSNPEGYRKALRMMQMAEKFNIPIVTLIDTPGAYPGLEAEERGQAEAIARNLREMFGLRVPILSIIIGEGASGGALGIAIGDRVAMLENTWYSVISPESCSSILWRSWEYKEQAAEALHLTAQDMKNFGLIDDIIQEPLGGAHNNWGEMAQYLKDYIFAQLQKLVQTETNNLLRQRRDKFQKMGQYKEREVAST